VIAKASPPQRPAKEPDHERLCGIDGRSGWVRRSKDLIAEFVSDIPNASAAERSLIRRCAVLTVQLEMLEQKFAQARGDAAPAELDLYQKIANTLRRHLSTLGLQRRAKDVGPTLGDLIRQDQQANRERLARERAEDAPS
jgi:hypothetical protein